MKVLYCMVTDEGDEPLAVEQFIAGYESAGGTWTGTVDVDEGVSSSVFYTEDYVNNAITQGYDLILYNSYIPNNVATKPVFERAIENGLLLCIPVGTNDASAIGADWYNNFVCVTCGSGIEEYGNATGYPCLFYDTDPAEAGGNPIVDVRQCGETYTITHIQRRTSNLLSFKLEGITDTTAIGLSGRGTPVMFTDLAGSDISPLPTLANGIDNIGWVSKNVHVVTFAGGAIFFISFATTAGTINTGFLPGDYQACTGTLTFGHPDTSVALVRFTNYENLFAGAGLTIDGVTGFENNINARMTEGQVYKFVNYIGWGDMIEIYHELGAGSYEGGGVLYRITQSYSTPYIGGKLAFIKDTLNSTWQEVIGRAIVTANGNGVYDSIDGFGIIDVNGAKDALLYIGMQTELVLEIVSSSSSAISLAWNIEPFADYYEVYRKGVLIDTVLSQITSITVTDRGQPYGRLNMYKVRAMQNNGTAGEFSNEVENDNYYQAGIATVSYGVQPSTSQGYGFNYGLNYGVGL